MPGKKTTSAGAYPAQNEWETPGGRVRWLLDALWEGKRSAMATDVGVSRTTIIKIVTAGREPGRRLLQQIASHPKVNPAWLLSGQGQPLLEAPAGGERSVPVAGVVLPGPPQQHPDLLTRERIDSAGVFAATQYWLRLEHTEPIVFTPARGLRRGDLLLMETDRRRFPEEGRLNGHLSVVKNPRGGEPHYLLGLVDYFPASLGPEDQSPAYLKVESFEQEIPEAEAGEQIVITRFPRGEMAWNKKKVRVIQGRTSRRVVEFEFNVNAPELRIAYHDIVAVWTGLLRRAPNSI